MPTLKDDDACISCRASRPAEGWPTAYDVGPAAGEQTRQLVLQDIPGGFEVRALLAVDPGRWVYRVLRRESESAVPLELVALSRQSGASLPQASVFADLEARMGVRAPALQRVFAVGELDRDRVYAVVEPLAGAPLYSVLAHGSLPLGRFLHLAIALVEFLHGLWDAGATAGPITPSRVFLEPQWNGTDHVQVQSTWFLGPEGPRYDLGPFAAPEWRPGRDTRAADVFSLGATLVRVLTGKPAYSREDRSEALRRGEPPIWQPLQLDDGEAVPADLNEVLRRMLAYDPGARPLDLRAVRMALEDVLADNEPSIAPPMLWEDVSVTPQDQVEEAPATGPAVEEPEETAVAVAAMGPVLVPVPADASTPSSAPTVRPSEPRIGTGSPAAPSRGAWPMLWFGLAFAGTALVLALVALIVSASF